MTIPITLAPAVGIGLKPQHYAEALGHTPADTLPSRVPDTFRPGWVEVHPQNYYCAGGPPHRWLEAIARDYPLSFHSVGLSLGSARGLDDDDLRQLARLCERYGPSLISDHLSWSASPGNRFPDLLPVPYTRECLDHFVMQVGRAQDVLGRMILIENPSRYLAFAHDEMGEAEFLHALCEHSGCGLLLDINNVEVSATNLGLDPFTMLDAVDPALVGEVHLAGHATERHDGEVLLIDDHGSPVSELSWQLFQRFIARSGPRPVLVEWDTNVPAYQALLGQAKQAAHIMERASEIRDAA